MKILVVNSYYHPDNRGGAEIIARTLAEGMVARGHRVRAVATTGGEDRVREDIGGVEVVRLPIRNSYWPFEPKERGRIARLGWHARDAYNARAGRDLELEIDEFSPDVICAHNLSGFSSAAWDVAYQHGIPLVQMLHDYYHVCPSTTMFKHGRECQSACGLCRLYRLGRSAQSRKVSAVLSVSAANLNIHLKAGLFSGVKATHVVHNANSVEVPENISPRPLKADKLVFGFIGALNESKGIHILIKALRLLGGDLAGRYELLVAGKGEPEFQRQLEEASRDLPVTFVGYVKPMAFFSRIDVCCAPSIWNDSFPGAVFEALANGVPVIGSRRGGIPEMVLDGENGLLVEPNAAPLAAAMERLLMSPGQIGPMSAAALRSSAPFVDVDRMLDAHEAIYAQACAGTRSDDTSERVCTAL